METDFESWESEDLDREWDILSEERSRCNDDDEYDEITEDMEYISEILEERGFW